MASPDIKKKIIPFINPFIIVLVAIIAVMSYVVFRTGAFAGIITSSNSIWVIIALIAFPLVLLSTIIFASMRYNRIVAFLYVIAVMWFPAIMYLFLGAVVLAIISFFTTNLVLWAWIIIVCIVLKLIYGIINARSIRIKKYDVESADLAGPWSGKRIALVSDVHLGIVRSGHFMKRVVGIINDLKPDLVIIAGDIIDGPVFEYEKGLAPLKDIKTPQGVIYAPGNHEGYNWEPEKFYPIVERLTTALMDRTIIIDGVQIVGLRYAHESLQETKNRLSAAGFNPALPSVVIMHDPTNTHILQEAEVSLVVSGHTHKGQFFPFTLFMKSIYKEFAYGKNVKGKTTSITTSGVGTMMPPLRLGSNPEIVVLTIKGQ